MSVTAQLGKVQTAVSWLFFCVIHTHTMSVCLTWEWVRAMSPSVLGLRPLSGSAGSELTESSQTLHTHVFMGPCELCISKTFPTCLLCVTHSLSGTCRVRKGPPFLLVLCWKWMATGGCHHPDNVAPQYPPLWPSPGATPSTVPPWWWGLHTHAHTHTHNQIKQDYSASC